MELDNWFYKMEEVVKKDALENPVENELKRKADEAPESLDAKVSKPYLSQELPTPVHSSNTSGQDSM